MSAVQTPTRIADPSGPGSPTTKAPRAWPIVAAREAMVRLTDRNFLVGTAFTVLVLLGAFGVQFFLESRTSSRTIAVVDQRAEEIVTATGTRVSAEDDKRVLVASRLADRAAGEAAVRDGSADALLVRAGSGWEIVTHRGPEDTLARELGQTLRERAIADNAAAAGTTADALVAGSALTPTSLDPEASAKSGAARVLGFIFAALFYMAALTFGLQIASSVVEEKQSRVVEILATAIPVRQLLIGKIVGNTALALGQLVLYAAVGLLGASLTKQAIGVSSLLTGVGWFLVFFLAGFIALACMWAVAGSLASRSEDLQSTTSPLTIVLVLAFIVGMSVEGTVRTICSFVPILSAIIMPGRIAAGEAAVWEALVALGLTLVLAALTVLAGERLYRRSLLQNRGRVAVRHAWRSTDEVAVS